MRLIAALSLVIFLLAGCQTPVTINATSVGSFSEKIPGKYAVFLQDGAWKKDIKLERICDVWSYSSDFNAPYQVMARHAFSNSFQSVDFVPAELTPTEVEAKGYDAQVIVYQGALNSADQLFSGLFSAELKVEIELAGIVAVTSGKGLIGQESPRGRGELRTDLGLKGCPGIDNIIASAAERALSDYVSAAVEASREIILQARAE